MGMQTLYNDTYKGPRWRYRMTLRPLLASTLPDDFIVHSDRPDPKSRHGTIDYPRELGAAVIERENLEFVGRIAAKGAPIDYTRVEVGMTVVRLADRAKPRPKIGTVERVISRMGRKGYETVAVVAWDNVWGWGGKGDHHSTIKIASLMRWVEPT